MDHLILADARYFSFREAAGRGRVDSRGWTGEPVRVRAGGRVPRILYFDCFSGASGDMILGALVDAGLPIDALRNTLATLGVGDVTVVADRVTRHGVSATRVRLVDSSGHDVAEDHHHRGLDAIRRLIEGAPLQARIRDTSIALFVRLAEAEAAVQDTAPERVHFHEVGALDSILDLVTHDKAGERKVTLGA